jgi:hypothetical protein
MDSSAVKTIKPAPTLLQKYRVIPFSERRETVVFLAQKNARFLENAFSQN